MDYVLETRNLTKKYRHTTALEDVNLSLQRGKIYGFVGNNGAGKTTLMRIIMGLSFPTSGELSLFGKTRQREVERQRSRIGALIEDPVYYENMSARQNLVGERIISMAEGEKDVNGLLKKLGIAYEDVGRKKLRAYSVGMKQRYGLASALLGEPEFLVLDEPISGVDPSGVRELRGLFTNLNREKGVTMLLSSHILSELYQVATDFIFIHRGRIIHEITHDELQAKFGGNRESLDDYFLDFVEQAEG